MSQALTIKDASVTARNGSEKYERVTVALADIRADQRAQPREHLVTDTAQAYADAMAAGDEFPPLIVFHDDTGYWLADGFHRRYAALSLGLAEFPCNVMFGGLRDAILYSCQVNASHGVQRTSADKRRAVGKLLEDDEWSHWSDREISRRARVSPELVKALRAEIAPVTNNTPAPAEPRTYRTKHGTVAKMNTAAIGGATKPATTSAPATTRTSVEPPARQPPKHGKAAVCERVLDAVKILSGLPPAHEVVGYFAGTDSASLISERLSPAAAWLADFSDAWKDNEC